MGLHNVPFGELDAFHVVVEIPMGSQDKYEYDEKLDVIKLDRVVYSSYHYPTNYGFVPETRAEDGDHADVLLLSTNPLAVGCVVEARAIGFMEMIDAGENDHKIIAVPIKDPRFSDIMTLDDLPQHLLKEYKNFFETLKTLQNKVVEVKGFQGVDRAREELQKTREVYSQEVKV